MRSVIAIVVNKYDSRLINCKYCHNLTDQPLCKHTPITTGPWYGLSNDWSIEWTLTEIAHGHWHNEARALAMLRSALRARCLSHPWVSRIRIAVPRSDSVDSKWYIRSCNILTSICVFVDWPLLSSSMVAQWWVQATVNNNQPMFAMRMDCCTQC